MVYAMTPRRGDAASRKTAAARIPSERSKSKAPKPSGTGRQAGGARARARRPTARAGALRGPGGGPRESPGARARPLGLGLGFLAEHHSGQSLIVFRCEVRSGLAQNGPASGVRSEAMKMPRPVAASPASPPLAMPGGWRGLGRPAGLSSAPIFPALIFRGCGLISALQGCGVRGEQCDPGAYKIRTGAVPVRDRGSGHTAPTYIS